MPDELTTELLAAERSLQAAQLAGDVETLDQLLHDRLLETAFSRSRHSNNSNSTTSSPTERA